MIDKVIKYNYCAGCGLCQSFFGKDNVAVELDKAGFYRPNQKTILDAESLRQFSHFCPGLSVKKEKSAKAPLFDSIWGEMHSCIVGSSSDDEIRREASSGGAITSILVYLLDNNLVDAIIHIGSSEEKPYLNQVKLSTNRNDVIKNANSRYSPSAPLVDILQQLVPYERYAFVGKPCDVAALRQFSKYNDVVRNKVKYYFAFFCAGTPSLNATKEIVEAMDVDINDVKSLHYRKDGWPGYFRIVDENNVKHKLAYSLTWMNLLGPKVQFRCKICADGIGHLADIVCADAWEHFDGKGFPTFKNAPGKSLIITRTASGESLLRRVLSDNSIIKDRDVTNFREVDKMQPGQLAKKINYLSRISAVYFKNRLIPVCNKEFYYSATFRQSILNFIKGFIGTLRRIR